MRSDRQDFLPIDVDKLAETTGDRVPMFIELLDGDWDGFCRKAKGSTEGERGCKLDVRSCNIEGGLTDLDVGWSNFLPPFGNADVGPPGLGAS